MTGPLARDAEAERLRFRRMTRISIVVLALILSAFLLIGYTVFYTNLFAYRPLGIVAQKTFSLAFTRPGRLWTLDAEEGMAVEKGRVIARLSDTALQADIREAAAALARHRAELSAARENLRIRAFDVRRAHDDKLMDLQISEDNLGTDIKAAEAVLEALRAQTNGWRLEYERAHKLLPAGTITRQEFDRIETEYESRLNELATREKLIESYRRQIQRAQERRSGWEGKSAASDVDLMLEPYLSAVAEAEIRLENMRTELLSLQLAAPEDGTLVRVAVEAFEVLQAGQPVCRLIANQAPYVETYVEEYYLDRFPLRGGVTFETLESEIRFPGTVVYVGPEMVRIPEALVPGGAAGARYGRMIRCSLPAQTPPEAMVLPGMALRVGSDIRRFLDFWK